MMRVGPAKAKDEGFTLIEIIVTVGIISLLTVMLATGYPRARDRQTLVATQYTLEAALQEAQQLALNEVRESACTDQFPGESDATSAERRRCSQTGIAIRGRSIILFADTSGNTAYDASTDYKIRQNESLREGVSLTGLADFVFVATPPTLELYADGEIVTQAVPRVITMHLGQQHRELVVSPFGKLEAR